jgi:hypothetical protein
MTIFSGIFASSQDGEYSSQNRSVDRAKRLSVYKKTGYKGIQ